MTSVGANVVHSGSASGIPDSQRHTTVSAQSDNGFRCGGFFSVFMFDGKKPKHSMAKLREHLEILAPQMVEMGTDMLILHDIPGFQFDEPGVHTQSIDFEAAARDAGFNMQNYKKVGHRWNPMSHKTDIMRFLLAGQTGRAYIDTDIVFIKLDLKLYTSPFVGLGMFRKERDAAEVTCSSFCIPLSLARACTSRQRHMLEQTARFEYRDLGPGLLLHQVTRGHHAVRLLPQNNPASDDLLQNIDFFDYPFFHITSSLRNRNAKRFGSYASLVSHALRQASVFNSTGSYDWKAAETTAPA